MSRYPFVGVSIHSYLINSINLHIDSEICSRQYRSVSEFIEDAIIEKMKKCNIPIITEDSTEIEFKISKIFKSVHKITKGYYFTEDGILIILKQVFQEGRGDFKKSISSLSNQFKKIVIITPSLNKKIYWTLNDLNSIPGVSIEFLSFPDLDQILHSIPNDEKITFEKLKEMNLHNF